MDKLDSLEVINKIALNVDSYGGQTFFVGGCVRDMLLGIESEDIDIEVHGINPSLLENIIDNVGERITIGESFGIYSIKGYQIDIAMPRKEKLRGVGHKDFDVIVDPNVGTKNAAMRRDFTINSIMKNVLTSEIVDHFNGVDDLKNKIIRHVNDQTFCDDPLRVLRAAQFASRFEFSIASETIDLCRKMNLCSLSSERVEGELKKALLKSNKPSIFFESLLQMNQLKYWFKELEDLIGIKQNPYYHSEGDVWVHTMMVLDEAVKYRDNVDNPFGFMLSTITHDFGKVVTTKEIDGVIRSYQHDIKGVPLADIFMKRLTNEVSLIKYVLNLTEYHMRPNILASNNSSIKATNKMFDLAIDPMALICLAMSDSRGKIAQYEYISYDEYLFERLEIYHQYMSRPYVTGKDLVNAGLKPSKDFSKILDYAHKLRLAGINKEEALKQVLVYCKRYKI